MQSFESEVLSKIQKIILKKVSLDEQLLESGLVDSLSVMELVEILEQDYLITIPLDQLADIFCTPKSIIDFLVKNK